MVLQDDGNLMLFGPTGSLLWSSGIPGTPTTSGGSSNTGFPQGNYTASGTYQTTSQSIYGALGPSPLYSNGNSLTPPPNYSGNDPVTFYSNFLHHDVNGSGTGQMDSWCGGSCNFTVAPTTYNSSTKTFTISANQSGVIINLIVTGP